MPDPTPAIPLAYATDTDRSLARAVAVCHWVAIGVLAIHTVNLVAPVLQSLVPVPLRIAWYSYDLTNFGFWERARFFAQPTTTCLSLLFAVLSLRRGRAAWRAWVAMLLLSVVCAGGLSIYHSYFYTPDPPAILLPTPLERKIMNLLESCFASPEFLLLVLFTRPPIVRARWTR